MTKPETRAAFQERLEHFEAQLAQALRNASRTKEDVQVIAVSKKHSAESVLALAALGMQAFGENFVQEALAKQQAVQEVLPQNTLQWHFIGQLQSNKAKDVTGRFALIHTLDSEKTATILDRRLDESVPFQDVLVQVNVGRETQKGGVLPEALPLFIENIIQLPRLRVQGLMCMPPVFDSGDAARPYFAALRQMKEETEQRFGLKLPHLSMGMSGDFAAAIGEGATLIRIGTTLFGERLY